MAKAKKAFDVAEFKDSINATLASYSEKEASHDFIQGLRAALEGVLKSTGNYRGYDFLNQEEVPAGERPGCRAEFLATGRFEFSQALNRLVDNAYETVDANRVRYR